MELVKRLFKEEEGQGMIEYVLIAAFISIAAIASLTVLKPLIQGVWTDVATALGSI